MTSRSTADPPGLKIDSSQRTQVHGSPSVHLDALRGVAAFSVLLMHWRNAFFVDYANLPQHGLLIKGAYFLSGLGSQWVTVFFVMSGYLVGGSVIRSRRQGRWSWRNYLLTRGIRLYIVLLPALLLGGLADLAGMHVPGAYALYRGQSGMDFLKINVYDTLNLKVLAGNLAFLQTDVADLTSHHVPCFGSNGPLWSLSNEFWYYIAFPFLMIALSRSQSWLLRLVSVFALFAVGWFVGIWIVMMGFSWMLGVALVYLPGLPTRNPLARRITWIAASALFIVALAYDKANPLAAQSEVVLSLCVTFLIWAILHCATSLVSRSYAWLAVRAARSSYTLYLVHMPMLILLKALLHVPQALPNLRTLLIGGAVLVGIIVYAQVIYLLFEKNTDAVRNWLKPFVFRNRSA